MSDIKISQIALEAVKDKLHTDVRSRSEIIQLAINEACKPLMDALEKVASGNSRPDCKGTHEDLRISVLQSALQSAQRTAGEALSAHHKEHGQ